MKTSTLSWRAFLVALQTVFFVMLLSFGDAATAQTIRYVKKNATGNGTGTSWDNAYAELADALKWANENKDNWTGSPLQIFVAKGTYKPMYKVAEKDLSNVPTTDRDKAFTLVKNVQLYGGFDPDNGIVGLDDRCLVDESTTILSGDLNDNDAADIALRSLLAHASRLDNAYHVILGLGDVGSACIDGFTVAGGNGDKNGLAVPIGDLQVYRGFGGGIAMWYSSPAIRHVTFRENAVLQSGAGIYTYASTPVLTWVTMTRNAAAQSGGGMMEYYSESKLTNVKFDNNWARSSGGGLYISQYSPKLTNVVFRQNATDVYGGAIYHYQCSPQYINVSITGNAAGDRGGAMFNWQSSPRFTNATITGNSGVYYTAGIFSTESSSRFSNSIIWGNVLTNGTVNNMLNLSGSVPEYQNSIVQGSGGSAAWKNTVGLDKGSNLDTDPLFTSVANGDYTPAPGSPMIDAGSNALYTNAGGSLADKDLAGFPRLNGTNIDMGAYETVDQASITTRYVRQGFLGKGQSWENASGDLQAMINQSAPGNEIWVAGGTFTPGRKASDLNTITPDDPENAFVLKNDVKIYGGFSGCETNPAQRNPGRHESILSGDLGSGARAYHVVLAIGSESSPVSSGTILDGFRITSGVANSSSSTTVNGQSVLHAIGAGIYNYYSSAAFSNINLSGNYSSNLGGGVMNWNSASTFTGLIATGNTSPSGAAVANYVSSTTFLSSKVSGNAATWGGGFYNVNSTPVISGALISGNTADYGSAIYNSTSSPVVTNATISANTNFAIYNTNTSSSPQLRNSIVYGNTEGVFSGIMTYRNSLVQGVEGGTNGNPDGDIDPLFTNLPAPGLSNAGDYALQACSPLINVGNNDLLTGLTTDVSGSSRIYGSAIDLGAYEFQSAIQTGADRLAANGSTASIQAENSKTYRVTAQGEICRSVLIIQSNGSAPVTGSLTVTSWVDASVQTHNNSPYVQRHYDITPAANSETATATITLFFTQPEFTAFNTASSSGQIPTQPDDAAGKSKLRIFQYHGTAADGNGPGSYTGSPVVIDPSDDKIVWNQALERWEVTFDVTGFSGFFAGSEASPLPVKLVSFAGKLTDKESVDLKWTVAEQSGILEYVVEYSANAREFTEVGRVQASASANDVYQFEAIHPFAGSKAYYRLHILEADADSYSRIISLNVPETAKPIVYPMPARDFVWVKGTRLSGNEIKLINMQGRVIQSIVMQSDEQRIDISALPTGMYLLQMPFGLVQKVVKQ